MECREQYVLSGFDIEYTTLEHHIYGIWAQYVFPQIIGSGYGVLLDLLKLEELPYLSLQLWRLCTK